MDALPLNHDHDRALASRAAAGDEAAWHDFVLSYAGLIRAIVRRYHPARTSDEQLSLFVEILEYMYHQGLSRYDGRAALSTWVITVARSRTLDALRHDYGRRRLPGWYESLTAVERQVYQLGFVELRSIPEILHRLEATGTRLSESDLRVIVDRLVSRLEPTARKRHDYEVQARSQGMVTARFLQVFDHLRAEQAADGPPSPDTVFQEKQARELMQRIEACMAELDEPDRQVLVLRYFEAMTAPDIARRLNLPGSRRVYTLLNRALAALRRVIEARHGPLDAPRWRSILRRGPWRL